MTYFATTNLNDVTYIILFSKHSLAHALPAKSVAITTTIQATTNYQTCAGILALTTTTIVSETSTTTMQFVIAAKTVTSTHQKIHSYAPMVEREVAEHVAATVDCVT